MTKLVEEANLWGKGVVRSGGTEEEDSETCAKGRWEGQERGTRRESRMVCVFLFFFRKKGMEMGSEGGEKKNQMKGEGWEVSWEQEERVRIKKEAG